MKKWRAILGSGLLVASLAACGNSASSGDSEGSYNVGVLIDQTGVSAFQGVPMGAGVQSYIKMINASGGVNGKQIKVKVADSKSEPQAAQTSVQELLSEQPLAVVGFTGSAQMAAIPPIAEPAGIPFLMGIASDSQLLPAQDWLYTVYMPTAKMMSVILSRLDQTLGGLKGKRLAVSAADTPFGDGFTQAFKDEAKVQGYTAALVDRHSLQLTTFAPNAAKVVDSKSDALILLDLPSNTPQIVKDTTAAGFKKPIVGYEQAGDTSIIKATGTSQYSAFRGAQLPAPTGTMADAAKKAGFTDQLTSPQFSYGWAEGALLVEALKKCGNLCDGEKLKSALQSISDFTVPDSAGYGPVGFSKSKHYATNTVQFYTWDPSSSSIKPTGDPVSLDE